MRLKLLISQLASPPVQVALVIALIFSFGTLIPLPALRAFLTASLLIKTLLSLFLPWLVLSFLYLSLSQMKSGVIGFILTLLVFITASNFIANLIGFSTAQVLVFIPELCPGKPTEVASFLLPYFKLNVSPLFSTKIGLVLGFAFGFLSRFAPNSLTTKAQTASKTFIHLFISKFFVPLLPLFVGGFVAKLNYEGALDNMISDYGSLILLIVLLQFLYCFVLLLIASGFKKDQFISLFKDLLPPYLTGMMTMSGAAALPLSIKATKKHLKNPAIADGFLPPATNTHLLGDGISVPFLITALLVSCETHFPSFWALVSASLYMAFLRFGIVSIPGGGIFVMLPLLEGTFHFTGEMTGLITAIYILFDLFNTANNVLGNGASTLIFERFWTKISKIKLLKM